MNSNNSGVAILKNQIKQVPSVHYQQSEVGILLSDVEPEQVEWLWPGRIPLGKLTILEGDPDKGKSVMTLDFAARVTRYCQKLWIGSRSRGDLLLVVSFH